MRVYQVHPQRYQYFNCQTEVIHNNTFHTTECSTNLNSMKGKKEKTFHEDKKMKHTVHQKLCQHVCLLLDVNGEKESVVWIRRLAFTDYVRIIIRLHPESVTTTST